jgi:hypothetical protein
MTMKIKGREIVIERLESGGWIEWYADEKPTEVEKQAARDKMRVKNNKPARASK